MVNHAKQLKRLLFLKKSDMDKLNLMHFLRKVEGSSSTVIMDKNKMVSVSNALKCHCKVPNDLMVCYIAVMVCIQGILFKFKF